MGLAFGSLPEEGVFGMGYILCKWVKGGGMIAGGGKGGKLAGG
jgi:hypothetical protein